MVNIDNVKITKKLGAGMLGTAYLGEYAGKQYVIKIQHILEKEKIKDYKNELWRELDLYKYITKLDKEDKTFFTNLYDYKIYDKCTHIQERPFKIDLNDKKNEFAQRLKKLDESEWCVKYLLDYKGKTTLHTFLQKSKLTHKQIYSLMIQVCKIILILYDGGYSHNDLHPGNIMINETSKKYFNFMDKKIPFNGYQLTAIDYGEVLHKKFGKNQRKRFLEDREKYMFDEIFWDTLNIVDNIPKLIDDCKKLGKKLPWERKGNTYDDATKKMILNHPDFYIIMKHKYVLLYPESEKLFSLVESKLRDKKEIPQIIKNKKGESDFWNALNRIIFEFNLFFPKETMKYWKWCSSYEPLLPKEIIQELLTKTNHIDYVNYLIEKIV